GERPSFAVRGSSFVVREPAFSAPERRPSDSIAVFRGARLLLFGGKGGVGKTTCAAAAALRLAASEPARPVLLLSTDPAHSLGDVLGLAIGDRARSVPGAPANLRVRELDAAAAMAARRAGIEAALEEIASAFGAGLDEHRGRGVSELMDLAPPGIDELFAVLSIGELLSPGQDRLVVLDMAPTGHALVINAATLAPGRCPRCRATAAAERPQRGGLARACRTRSRDCAIILAPLAAPPPRGVAQLEVWARLWSEQ